MGLVIDLLHQMTFKALIREEDVERERNAVLNEMRDSSDISERIASKFYQQLFAETLLPRRFPIGKLELVQRVNADGLRRFYEQHYFPSNMHLFLVGDFDAHRVLQHISSSFSAEPPGPRAPPSHSRRDSLAWATPPGPLPLWPLRGARVEHTFGSPPSVRYEQISHSQVSSFSLTLTMKEELESNVLVRHVFEELVDSLVGMALEGRFEELRTRGGAAAVESVDWMFLNSAREGCVLNSLVVTSEGRSWRRAARVFAKTLQELISFGLVQSELDRLLRSLVKQYKTDAEQEETMESDEVMEELMECVEAGDAFLSAGQKFELVRRMEEAITLELVNHRVQQLFSFASLAGRNSELCAWFVCAPKREGRALKELSEATLREEMKKATARLEPYRDASVVPSFLCEDEEMDQRMRRLQPCLVPVRSMRTDGTEKEEGTEVLRDPGTGVRFMELSNGMRVTVKGTSFQKKEFTIEIRATGGRATEVAAGMKKGAVMLAIQVQLRSGLGQHDEETTRR